MRSAQLVMLVAMTACGPAPATKPDARVLHDGSTTDVAAAPYRHVISIDGNDDFSSADTFPTTSASFVARIAWDDKSLFVGYSGPDLATSTSDAGTKWLFVYLDTAPGGEAQSELYRTQRATFPTGFAADAYARYKVDGTFSSLRVASGGTWTDGAPALMTAQSGTYLEMAIPLSAIGAGSQLSIVTWMINEKDLAEGTFAGLYNGNFTDGYAANLALTAYLQADFTSARVPNDDANRKP